MSRRTPPYAAFGRVARGAQARARAQSSWAGKVAGQLAHTAEQRAAQQLKDRSEAEFQQQITTVRIRLMMIDDGDDAAELLGIVAVVIGTPMQYVYTTRQAARPAWAAQLRGALKTVVQMCLQGYRWQAGFALAIERAVEIAATADVGEITDARMADWTQAWLDANYLCARIQDKQIDGTEVV